jgi:thiamine pyrophosphate-dependent acetolactate synthase large subunit-like protein
MSDLPRRAADTREACLDRREVVVRLLDGRGDLLVIAGLGSPSYDLMAAGDDARNFYLWGAMGGAAMIGLGLALARRQESVLVLTGDGEQLMALGALALRGEDGRGEAAGGMGRSIVKAGLFRRTLSLSMAAGSCVV